MPINRNLPTRLPGFPIVIADGKDTPATVAAILQQFHSACETGDMIAANELLIDASIAMNEFALHHFNAVYHHTIVHDAAFVPAIHPKSED